MSTNIIYGNSRLLFNINGHEYLVQHPQDTIAFTIIYGLFVVIYVQRKTPRGSLNINPDGKYRGCKPYRAHRLGWYRSDWL